MDVYALPLYFDFARQLLEGITKGLEMPFSRSQGRLHANDVPLSVIAAQVGTPCYVYVWQDIEQNFQSFKQALTGLDASICYAVKANSNINLLGRIADLGVGFDIVSAGELERVLYAKGDPSKVVFSGVGKSQEEISFALKVGIAHFNVESESEARLIEGVASQLGIEAALVVRVNPNISVDTHRYITTGLRENKFGLPEQVALKLIQEIHQDFKLCTFKGIACHIGSQLNDIAPYEAAVDAMLKVREELITQGIPCDTMDLGGGFGIQYQDEEPLSFQAFGDLLRAKATDGVRIEVEPGRSIVGKAGVLLTHVEYLKTAQEPGYQNFCVVNAAMNDLLRPALYQAYHHIESVEPTDAEANSWNVVGPVCETGDFLGNDRNLSVNEGDLLAIRDVGAYGFVLSSNYNSRLRAPEVLVDRDLIEVIRRRETVNDLIRLEQPLA